MAAAIAELSETCRRARTGLWCALQMSWKPGFIPLGVMSKRAEVIAREKQALKEQQQLVAAQAAAVNRPASASSSASSQHGSAGGGSSTSALSLPGSLGSPLLSTGSSMSLLSSDHMTSSQQLSPAAAAVAVAAGYHMPLPLHDNNNNHINAVALSKVRHN